MTQASAALSFTGAVKTYGPHRAVDGIDPGIARPAPHRALGAILVLTSWLLVFCSYAVLSYRRSAGTS
ncbi:hypothetical protein [Streptomyces herbicida]|uniref:hypothetical protein n=1 Tax=Streptomyces herbicida TaxID=3065675 RepID=UPI002931ACF5|nr:hypothetical protein [Streptomyces sp. NEAU-HV9]